MQRCNTSPNGYNIKLFISEALVREIWKMLKPFILITPRSTLTLL